MVGPSKQIKEYKNENPIYKFSQDLLQNYKRELIFLGKSRIKALDFASFITFIMVARKYEEDAPKLSLYKHIQQVFGSTEDTIPSIAMREDYFSKLMKRRRESRNALFNRLDIPNSPQFTKLDTGLQNRAAPRDGYELSRIQFLELCDDSEADDSRGIFGIQRKIMLRQFIDSHNKSGEAIKKFYTKLGELCKKRSETIDIDTRLAYAINLNKYENSIPVDMCYRTAKFCSDHLIKKISDDDQKTFLAWLVGSISGTVFNVRLSSTEKPVLLGLV